MKTSQPTTTPRPDDADAAAESITRYCDARALDLRARIALFAEACDAVARLHAHLALHGDLRPGNIVVDAGGRVRLLDAGIAESPGDGYASSSAAPEQVLGHATTVATDVYGLGCVLHELLAGTAPFRFANFAREAIVDTIAHRPAAPVSESARANDDAARRRLQRNGTALAAALRGDLDAIVARTLRKEPDQRYRSVDALVADVRNVLGCRPIAQRASERGYRFVLFVRRHRIAALVATVLGLALLATAVLSLAQYRRAAAERDRAVAATQLERDHARHVARVLVDTIGMIDPAAVASLERNASRQDPALRATIAQTLAHLYFTLDRAPDALRQTERARAALAQVAHASPQLLARQGRADAEAAFAQNRFGAAIDASAAAIERLGDAARVDDGDLLYDLWTIRGRAAVGASDSSDARRTFEAAIDLFARRADTPVERIDRLRQRHAATVSDAGDFATARDLLQALLDEQRARADADVSARIDTLRQLAKAHERLYADDLARPLLEQALNDHIAIHGDDNATAARLMADTASLFASAGQYDAALRLRSRAIAIAERRIGPDDAFVAQQYHRLGNEHRYYLRDDDPAERAYRRAIALTPAGSLGNRATYQQSLADLLIARDRRWEAEMPLREAERALDDSHAGDAGLLLSRASLAWLHYRNYAFDDARELLTPEVVAHVRTFGRSDPLHVDAVAQMDEMTAFFGL